LSEFAFLLLRPRDGKSVSANSNHSVLQYPPHILHIHYGAASIGWGAMASSACDLGCGFLQNPFRPIDAERAAHLCREFPSVSNHTGPCLVIVVSDQVAAWIQYRPIRRGIPHHVLI